MARPAICCPGCSPSLPACSSHLLPAVFSRRTLLPLMTLHTSHVSNPSSPLSQPGMHLPTLLTCQTSETASLQPSLLSRHVSCLCCLFSNTHCICLAVTLSPCLECVASVAVKMAPSRLYWVPPPPVPPPPAPACIVAAGVGRPSARPRRSRLAALVSAACGRRTRAVVSALFVASPEPLCNM